MKYFFTFLLISLLTLGFTKAVFAQNKTATPTNTLSQQQINELQSKIASKVAQLNLVEKRGVLGIVTDSSDTYITLADENGDIDNIDVDELTKFYSSNNSFGISDIKKDQTLGILGIYNKESKRILAREVNDISAPDKIIIGSISNIDRENYEITIVHDSGKKTVFEIQDTTKTFSYASGALVKSGFSKIVNDQTIAAVGTPDQKSSGKFLADRIILLPEINFLLKPITPTPATGSGLEFFPTGK